MPDDRMASENSAAKQTTDANVQTTIWTKSFISIFFTSLALNLGINMNNSILALYVDSLGAQAGVIGLLMSSFAISAILFRLVSAPIMDAFNRKHIVALATIVLSVAFFGFGLSKGIPALFGFRLLQGCGMAFGNACCLAIVADMLPKDKYSRGIGYYSLAQVMCQAVGPSVGLFLVDKLDYRGTFITVACVMLIATLLATQIKTNFTRTKKLKLSLNRIIAKEAWLPSTLMFLVSAGASPIMTFLILFARNQGVTSNIGLYFTVYAITMLATRPLVGRLTDKLGFVKVAIPALLCSFAAFFVISSSASLLSFLFAAFISAFGVGACTPALQSLTMKAVTAERRGVASATNHIGLDLGVLVSPAIAGGIVESFGYAPMWYAMSVFFLIAMLVMFLFRSKIVGIERNFLSGAKDD